MLIHVGLRSDFVTISSCGKHSQGSSETCCEFTYTIVYTLKHLVLKKAL